MAAKSSLVCLFQENEERTGALLGGSCLTGLDVLLFSFSSCSCEIRILQCLRSGLPDATFNSLTGHVSKEENAIPVRLARLERSQGAASNSWQSPYRLPNILVQ